MIAAALIAVLLGFVPALAEKPQLSADGDIEFDGASGSTIARGNATLKHGNLTVMADEIRYSSHKNLARATGEVRVNHGAFRLVGKALVYNPATGKTASENFRAGSPPLLASGGSFSGDRDEIKIEDAVLYFGEPHFSTPNIRARHATISSWKRLEADGVTFRIGDVPVFHVPHLNRPLDSTGFNIEGRIGFRGNLGAHAGVSGVFPVSPSVSTGLNLDAYSKRGVLIGPKFAVDYSGADGGVISRFDSGWISDRGNPGTDARGAPIGEDRGYLQLTHRHNAGSRLTLHAQFDVWSDSEILRDFLSGGYANNQDPDNTIEAIYRGRGFLVSAFARFRPNDFQAVRERLPEVRLEVMPQPILETGIFHTLTASASRLREEFSKTPASTDALFKADYSPPYGKFGPLLASNRFLLHYNLQRPTKMNGWLSFVPLAGVQSITYTDQEVRSGEGSTAPQSMVAHPADMTRVFGEVGFDAEIKAYATWDYKNSVWGIDGLRHVLRPVARFRHHFTGSRNPAPFARIDRRAFSVHLPPIDLGNIRYVDELEGGSLLRFGLENLLQTRDETYGSRNLLELNLYQDVLLDASLEEDTWAGLYSQLAFHPVHWLNFDFYSRIQTESLDFSATRAQLSVTNGDVWKCTFDTEFLADEVEQYRFSFQYKFDERWSGTAQIRYDARRDDINEQVFTVHQRLANTWNLDYQVIFRSGATREGNVQFNIRAGLVRF